MNKKIKKWPKFLTFKRTVLLLIILIAALSLTIYFVGGYKRIDLNYQNQDFSLDGFVPYDEYYDPVLAQVEKEQNALIDEMQTANLDIEAWQDIISRITITSARESASKLLLDLAKPTTLDENLKNELIRLRSEVLSIPDITASLYADTLLDYYDEVLKNDHFVLYFNRRFANFKLIKLDNKGEETDEVWYSNPEYLDVANELPAIRNKLLSQFVLSYATAAGAVKEYTSYQYTVDNKDPSDRTGRLIPYFSTKNLTITDTNGVSTQAFQVHYELSPIRGGLTFEYFPGKISALRWEELISRNEELVAQGAIDAEGKEVELLTASQKILGGLFERVTTETVDSNGNVLEPHWRISGQYNDSMTDSYKKTLYEILYLKCGYSIEEAAYDNERMFISVESTNAEFEVALQYVLTDKGLEAKILNNSIVENVNNEGEISNKIIKIDLLPYFGAVSQTVKIGDQSYTNSGQIYIPDGSGAAIDINSNKTGYVQISKRVYSTDLVFTSEIKPTASEDILLPMAGLVCNPILDPKTNLQLISGRNCLIYSNIGDAQMMINVRVAENNLKYNQVYFSVNYRDSSLITIGAGYYQKLITKYSQSRINIDAAVNYNILDESQNTVGDIAKEYREYLIKQYDLEVKDDTDEAVLNVDIIGAYDFRDNILGVSYTNYETMTTFSQIVEIVDELGLAKARNVNLYLRGWRNQGLRDISFEKFQISKEMGGKKAFKELVDDVAKKEQNVEIYPYVNFGVVNEYQESFGQSRYSARDISGEYVEIYPYHLSANVFDTTKRAAYVISPRFYQTFMSHLVTAFKKQLPVNNILFDNLGGVMVSDFKRHDESFRITSQEEQIKVLDMASDNIDKISLYTPYQFAIKYADNILNVPYEATLYEVIENNIPLYQLIINGLIDYSGISVNANDAKGTNWHLMNILGTGSNLAFTFSHDNSNELKATNYNHYTYTEYKNGWMDLVETMITTLNNSNIYKCVFVNYEKVATGVYKASYQLRSSYNSNENYQTAAAKNAVVEIYLNYSDVQFSLDGGILVPNRGYYISRNLGQ